MGAPRYIAGLICAALIAGCVERAENQIDWEEFSADSQGLNVDDGAEAGPNVPPPAENTICHFVQRGVDGAVQDTDVGLGNGPYWAPGEYGVTWTGTSPDDHWSLYKFDVSMAGTGKHLLFAYFSVFVSWNDQPSQVRAHRITKDWDEITATWTTFTHSGNETNYDPAVVAWFNPVDTGFRTIDVTPLVKSWLSGAVPNHGLLLEEDPGKLHNYHASESNSPEHRPSLYICRSCSALAAVNCTESEDCCTGSCIDGMCTVPVDAANPDTCIAPDEVDDDGFSLICSATSPCCQGSHCVDGLCQPSELLNGGTCSVPGAACNHMDDFNPKWCCWDRLCVDTDGAGNGHCQ
jgi:hypothetical protein